MKPEERQRLQIERAKKFDKVAQDIIIRCGEAQTLTYTYNGNPEDIEGYKIYCRSCTTVRRDGNQFIMTFKAPPCSDYFDNKARGETEQHYTSTVAVYFNDGEPNQKYNDSRELIDNPDKVAVSLQIRTRIQF